jgi:23S rRNA pseudouridine2605 synthase
MMRLNKFLDSAGIGSRRKCDDYIVEGKVSVNGEVVQKLGIRIEELTDTITFEGNKVKCEKNFLYIILNKPKGIITSAKDEYDRNTVLDLIPLKERLFPVGRLDQDTTGLILLTNDGELANKLIHPKFKIPKTYHIFLNKLIHPKDIYHFERGILLDDKKTAPCKLSEIRIIDNCSFIEVILYEGKKRQIRRMFDELGYKVFELDRIAFGPLTLAGIKRGEWRYLNKNEIARLKSNEQN